MKNSKHFFIHQAGAYRSGLEKQIQQQLQDARIASEYEPGRIEYQCAPSHYTPDFVLPNGIIIETKGYFLPADRTKHLLIKKQYPNLDLRFVFQNPNAKLNKSSKTTYAAWCMKNEFLFAAKRIPVEWLTERPNNRAKAAIEEILKRTK